MQQPCRALQGRSEELQQLPSQISQSLSCFLKLLLMFLVIDADDQCCLDMLSAFQMYPSPAGMMLPYVRARFFMNQFQEGRAQKLSRAIKKNLELLAKPKKYTREAAQSTAQSIISFETIGCAKQSGNLFT